MKYPATGYIAAGQGINRGGLRDRPTDFVRSLAEELLADRGVLDDELIGTAQVHATPALAAATAMASDFGNRA